MKTKISNFLSSKAFIITHIIIVALALFFNAGVIAMYCGLVLVMITLWSKQWDWAFVSFKTFPWKKAFKYALIWAVPVYLYVILSSYLVETYFGKMDLSSFDDVKGNPIAFVMVILYSWISAALGEELFFRGYVLNNLSKFFSKWKAGNVFALLITSMIFSSGHIYQGISGVLTTLLIGLLLGGIYLKYRSLKVVVLLHAIIDTTSLTLLYFNIL